MRGDETERVKRYVLTAGPSSGKTSLIKELERRGHNVIHEAARKVIDKRNKSGDKFDALEIQREIYNLQLKEEEQVNSGEVFLDRGIYDNLAYSKILLGYIPNEFLKEEKKRYDLVFLLERLQFENDGLRIEKSDNEAKVVHDEIKKAYENSGYELIPVPNFKLESKEKSISARADFVLDYVKRSFGGKE